jgi:hypothetical protein
MAILEEMIVIIMYLAVGWTIQSLPRTTAPVSNQSRKGNSTGRGGSQRNSDIEVAAVENGRGVPQVDNCRARPPVVDKKRRMRSPIHALVGAGIDAVQQRREEKAAANRS